MNSEKPRIINVVPYDSKWKDMFQKESILLKSVFGNEAKRIEHIGSTAIANMSAKPIIDILIEFHNIGNIDSFNEILKNFQYVAFGEYGVPGRRFFVKIDNGIRLVHLHIWQTGHQDINRHLAFRDYLNMHPDIAEKYSKLKECLAQQFPNDIQAYMKGKNDFIKQYEKIAMKQLEALSNRK